ncbi:FecR family protein [Pedobacter frigoris]|uniref:FecR family protein n=1 Tax=Pedobacter frigoris TaxID=2571272 RepID=UPI00292F52B1|nr:FecR family protein [Pedobacter frigoris]
MDEKNKKDLYKEFGVEDPSAYFEDDHDREKVRLEILERIQASKNNLKPTAKLRPLRNRRLLMAAAAISFLLLSIGLLFYNNFNNDDLITITVAKGKTQEVTLPDGSKVWLNAASTLKYPKKFGAKRIVYLEDGEGFFKVVHDDKVPFIVQSATLKTYVLGTSFVVKAYKSLSTATVSVVTGKVAVSHDDKQIGLLTRNQEVVYNKTNKQSKMIKTVAQEKTEWNDGKVILNAVYFEDMMLAIENAYQVNIEYDRTLFKNCQNSIRFNTKQSLKDVLDLIKDIQGINYELKEKEVIITGSGCN